VGCRKGHVSAREKHSMEKKGIGTGVFKKKMSASGHPVEKASQKEEGKEKRRRGGKRPQGTDLLR